MLSISGKALLCWYIHFTSLLALSSLFQHRKQTWYLAAQQHSYNYEAVSQRTEDKEGEKEIPKEFGFILTVWRQSWVAVSQIPSQPTVNWVFCYIQSSAHALNTSISNDNEIERMTMMHKEGRTKTKWNGKRHKSYTDHSMDLNALMFSCRKDRSAD